MRQTQPSAHLWQGCDCLVLVVFFTITMSLSFYGVYLRSKGTETATTEIDPRMELLTADMAKMTTLLNRDTDSLSSQLKECLDYDLTNGLDTSEVAYFTKVKDAKVLVLLRIENIKTIKPEYRKNIIAVVEDCLYQLKINEKTDQVYIGVEGRWNTVLVKTPTDADLGGRFANQSKLLPFYGDAPSIIEVNTAQDTLIQE